MTFRSSDRSSEIVSDTPCPCCNTQSTYRGVVENNDQIDEKDLFYGDSKTPFPYIMHFHVFQCKNCGRYRLIVEKIIEGSPKRDIEKRETVLEFPSPGHSNIQREKIDNPIILDNIDEGVRCLNANAPKGAIVNFRRALQAAALLLGGKGKDLFAQIDDLYNKEIIRGKTKEIAHSVRSFGNLGAHPYEIKIDSGGKVDSDSFSALAIDDARLALDALVMFLDDAFVYPDRSKELSERIDALKGK